jgi:hypothetical protein
VAGIGSPRVVDILALRLPSVPEKAPEAPKKQSPASAAVTPQLGSDKGKAQPTGISPKPMESTATPGVVHAPTIIAGPRDVAKPASGNPTVKSPGIKSADTANIKPATQQKTVPLPMKVSEKITKPAASTPKPPPNPSAPNQSGASQPTNQPATQPAVPPQDQTAPQENKPQ